MANRDVAALLSKARTEAGLTQEQLAARAGLHLLTVSKIERGRHTGIVTFERLAEALGCTLVIELRPARKA